MDKVKNVIPKVNKSTLILLAGGFWLFAGYKVFSIGFVAFQSIFTNRCFESIAALVIFALFTSLVFSKLAHKYTKRILELSEEKNFFYLFFNVKGYLIMAFMMTLGITVRNLNLLPNEILSSLYLGLGASLMVGGGLFIQEFGKYLVNKVK